MSTCWSCRRCEVDELSQKLFGELQPPGSHTLAEGLFNCVVGLTNGSCSPLSSFRKGNDPSPSVILVDCHFAVIVGYQNINQLAGSLWRDPKVLGHVDHVWTMPRHAADEPHAGLRQVIEAGVGQGGAEYRAVCPSPRTEQCAQWDLPPAFC